MKVSVVSGGFDPIHSGHIAYLNAAKEQGDILIVALNSDAWLTNKKGQPFMSFEERRTILENLSCVDEVIDFTDDEIVKVDGKNVTKPYYTTPELAEALAGRQATFGLFDHSFFRGLGAIKGASQSMKTVASHITHARNILGGAQFGLANGINPFSGTVNTFQTLVNNAKNKGDEGLDALYEKYLKLGIINTNVRVNEFRQLINEGAEIQSFDQLGGMFKRLDFYGSKKITDPVAGALSKGYKAAEKIYMGVDDFYKINAFNKELDTLRKALPDESIDVLEERAAQIVQDTFPNYDKVPNGIKAFRNLPIGSFVSFPAEIVRTSYHIVKQAQEEIATGNPVLVKRGKQRLAGFATSMSAWQGMAITGGYLAGLGTEEQEAVQKLSHTPWSKATRIPFRTDDGKLLISTPYHGYFKNLLINSVNFSQFILVFS